MTSLPGDGTGSPGDLFGMVKQGVVLSCPPVYVDQHRGWKSLKSVLLTVRNYTFISSILTVLVKPLLYGLIFVLGSVPIQCVIDMNFLFDTRLPVLQKKRSSICS